MKKQIDFLIQGVKNIKEVGALTRSGPILCKKMILPVPSNKDVVVVELGAGDGVITRHLLEKITPNSKVISIELLEDLHKNLALIEDDRLVALHETIDNLDKILDELEIDKFDHMVSAVPFMIMDNEYVIEFLKKYKKRIKKGGSFTQVHYGFKRKFYEKIFGNAKVHYVAANVPPALVVESTIV